MMQKKTVLTHLMAIFCILVWGTTFIVSKRLVEVFTPAQVMFLRFVGAYVVLWILHPKWKLCGKDEAGFLLLSLFANTLYMLAENTALKLTLASNVSILVSAAPILTAVLLRVFRREKTLNRNTVLGFFVAILGVALVVFNGQVVLKLNPLGDLLALAAALCWAFYGLLLKQYVGRYDSFFLSRKLMFYGILTSLPILAVEGAPMNWAALTQGGNLLGLLYLAVIASALCYAVWNKAIEDIGVVQTNVYVYANPLVTVIAAAIFLNEPVSVMGVAGMLLIILGMLVSSGVKCRKGKKFLSTVDSG